MDDALWIVLAILAVIVIVGVLYWMTRGKERRVEQQREQAAERHQEARAASQRAGEADLTARRHAEEAERERQRATELERDAVERDPDRPT